jgi:hypothetical protein
VRVKAFLQAVVLEEPSSLAGERFGRLYDASKAAKTHHEFMLAGAWRMVGVNSARRPVSI